MNTVARLLILLGLEIGLNAATDTTSPAVHPCQIRVLDPNHRPVAGAVVEGEIPYAWVPSRMASAYGEWRGVTDDKGMVSFTLTNQPVISFVAFKAGWSAGWLRWEAKSGDRDVAREIELTAPASVSGVVKDTQGRPVVEAVVWASAARIKDPQATDETYRFLISQQGRKHLTARTGAGGAFKIDGLPQHATLDLAVVKPGLALAPRPVSAMGLPYQAGQAGIQLTLAPAAVIEGRVVKETTAAPVAGARVIPLGYLGSNPLNTFPLTGPDGVFRLVDLKPGRVQLRTIFESPALADWVCEPMMVDVTAGAIQRDVKITAYRGGLVEVDVRTQAGNQPVENVYLLFAGEKRGERGYPGGSTSAQGLAQARLLPGQYNVSAIKAGWTFERMVVTCEVGKTNRVTLKAGMSPRLEGIVQDAEGKPAANVPVAIIPLMQEEAIRTDQQGRFSLIYSGQMSGGAPGQAFFLMARDSEHNLAAALEMETGQPTTNTILKLQTGLTLVGRVTDGQDKGISNALMRLSQQTPSSEYNLNITCATDAEGRYEFKGLPVGWRYRIDVSAKEYGGAEQSQTVGPLATNVHRVEVEPFELVKGSQGIPGVVLANGMPEGGQPRPQFSGSVIDANGKPAPNIVIQRIPGFSSGPIEIRTDAQGRFKMNLHWEGNRIRSMQYVVFALDPDHHLAASVDLDEEATNAILRLAPAWTWSARVVDDKGAGISNAVAQLIFPGLQFGGWFNLPVHTDAQGRLEIKDLPRGRSFRVGISAPGYSRAVGVAEAPDNGKNLVEAQPIQLIIADLALGGVALDYQDQPIQGASITISGENQPNTSCQTDKQGRFFFPAVCPGRIDISANGPYGLFASVTGEGGDTNMVIRLGDPGLQKDGVPLPTLTGTVVDAAGQPVKNIRVTVLPGLRGEGKTDAQGHFQVIRDVDIAGVELSEWVVMAYSVDGKLAASLDLEEGVTNVTVRLGPAWSLAGRVTNPSGIGLVNAPVQLHFHTDQIGVSLRQPVLTDAAGRYEIKGLAPGRPYRVSVSLRGYGRNKISVEPPTDRAQRVEAAPIVMLAADQVLAGVVWSDQGQPVKGASITFIAEGQDEGHSRTDNQGKFLIKEVCRGPVQISATDFTGGFGSVSANGGDTNIVIQFRTRWRNQDMDRQTSVIIPGIIINTDGQPAPNIRLTVFPSGQGSKRTDSQGNFSLILDAGGDMGSMRPSVVFAVDPVRNMATSLDLDEATTNADLKLEPAWTLAGRVLDASGAAVTNAQAQLVFLAAQLTAPYGMPIVADRAGRFEIKGLPPGRSFEVNLSAKGYGRARIRVEAPEAGTNRVDTVPVNLAAATLTVGGVVLDDHDQPVKGAWIYCDSEMPSERSYRTDSQGRFLIKGVVPGRVQISASDSNSKHATVATEGGDTNVVLRLMDSRQNWPIKVTRPLKIPGVVIDTDGQPSPNIRLLVYPNDPTQKTTDAQGRFSLDLNLSAGFGGTRQSVVFAYDPARNLAASLNFDEETTNIIMRLEPGWTLAGRVLDTVGTAVTNARVELAFHSLRLSPLYGVPVVTDRNGRFIIKGLPPGRSFKATYSASGYGIAHVLVNAPAAGTNLVDLDPVLLRAASLSLAGVVLDEQDRPVSSALVQVYSERQSGRSRMTDRQGRFLITGICPGNVQVSAHDTQRKQGSIATQGGDTNVVLRLVVPRESPLISAKLLPKISGAVIDPNGQPARYVRLLFLPSRAEKTADAEGRFTWNPNVEGFGMVTTQLVVLAMNPARNLAIMSGLDDRATNAILKLQPAWTWSGRVTEANGAVVTNAQAQLMIRKAPIAAPFGQPTITDNDGCLAFKGLPRDCAIEVSISANGFCRAQIKVEAPAVDKDRAEANPIQLSAANLTLGGVVLDEKDHPVGDAMVQFNSEQQAGNLRLTDRQGRFLFKRVCSGSLRVSANDSSGRYGSVAAEGGDTNVTLRLQLSERRMQIP